MFYREYRPQQFKELIGSKAIVNSITSSLEKGKPSHAYFFTGPRGIGKTSTARILAKALVCEEPIIDKRSEIKYEPCGKCKSCKQIEEGSYIDLIEIDAASNRGIENIRELRENVKLAPSKGKNKIYIIDEVHMLTNEASNALLKTLEEPPEHSYFILCTTNPEKVLDTIKSRCESYQLKRPSIEEIKSKLSKIADDQEITIEEEHITKIAILSKGAYREAETILQQYIQGDEDTNILLAQQEDNYFDFTVAVFSGEIKSAIDYIQEIYEAGMNLELWTENLVEYLRILMLAKYNVSSNNHSMELSEDEKKFAKITDVKKLTDAIEIFTDALIKFKQIVIPTLPIEMAIINISAVDEKQQETKSENVKTEAKEEVTHKKLSLKTKTTNNSAKDSVKQETKKEKESKKVKRPAQPLNFPYKVLIEKVKPMNHSIHLLLHSCRLINFDGKNLMLNAKYSFHKERLMSNKIRNIVEDTASSIIGDKVVLQCELASNNPKGKRLTDKNIVLAESDQDIDQVFEKVFGDDLEAENQK